MKFGIVEFMDNLRAVTVEHEHYIGSSDIARRIWSPTAECGSSIRRDYRLEVTSRAPRKHDSIAYSVTDSLQRVNIAEFLGVRHFLYKCLKR